MFKIVDGPIDAIALEDAVRTDADGAVIVFRGVARRFSRGRDVVHLEYEAYPEMAEKIMAQIGDEMKTRWPITEVAIVHRTGVLEIGQASVAIAVSAPHRGEAFAATRGRSRRRGAAERTAAGRDACERLLRSLRTLKPPRRIGWEHEAHQQEPVVR